jgi:hypothetical protein
MLAQHKPDSPGRSLFDPLVLLFALWTLATNVVVFSGGGLRQMVWAGVASLLLGAGLIWFLGKRGGGEPAAWDAPAAESASWERFYVLAIALACIALFLWRQDGMLLWLIGAPLCAWCLWRSVAWQPSACEPQDGKWIRLGLWGLALVCLGLTLWAHRADFDDAFYINMAVHAADYPAEALLSRDTMHGIEGLPLALSVYRIQSFELLAGAIAWLTPWEAIEVLHVFFPALIALMIPFGLALLLRRLVPGAWLLALAFALLFLFAAGDPHRSFGNFSFMRLQQGKSVLLTLILPLVMHYAMAFGERPGLRSFLLLSAVQIAALGTNVTALWLAPTCAMLALLAVLPCSMGGLRRLGWGLASCAYPLGAGLILSRSTAANLEATGLTVEPAAALLVLPLVLLLGAVLLGLCLSARPGRLRAGLGGASALLLALWCLYLGFFQTQASSEWLAGLGVERAASARLLEGLGQVLGEGWYAALFMLALLAGWSVTSNPGARRLWALSGGAFLLLFWNPMLAELLAGKVTGGPTYWRVFWVLPAAALMGSSCASLVGCVRALPGPRGIWPVSSGLLLAAGLLFLPKHSSLSPKNQVFLAPPGLRARQVDLGAARALARFAGPQSFVLAPVRVSPWIPTMHQHPFPLMVRRPYMKNLEGHLEKRDIKERSELTRLVSGPKDSEVSADASLQGRDLQRLLQGIKTYGLQAVCLANVCVGSNLSAALGGAGMQQVSKNRRYQVWAKP